MRAFFKPIMKASGTPVLQTWQGGKETILSAGNIWTSAHARRIELSDRGLVPGAVVCSNASGFQAVIDFVACAIGGFVYLPVTQSRLWALRQELAMQPIGSGAGIMFIDDRGSWDHHPGSLPCGLAAVVSPLRPQLAIYPDAANPLSGLVVFTSESLEAWLHQLSVRLNTPAGGTRLSYRGAHPDLGFVVDLLLGLCNRQTIHMRSGAETSPQDMLREIIELGVDDLVLMPEMLDALAHEARHLRPESRETLRRIRLHTGGAVLSAWHLEVAYSLFSQVFIETVPEVRGDRAGSIREKFLSPAVSQAARMPAS